MVYSGTARILDDSPSGKTLEAVQAERLGMCQACGSTHCLHYAARQAGVATEASRC